MDSDGFNGEIEIRGENQDEVFKNFSKLIKYENNIDLDKMEINFI